MKELVFEKYLEPILPALFGGRSEDCEARIEFELWLDRHLPCEVQHGVRLLTFRVDGLRLGFTEDVIGHALISEHLIEIKALELANLRAAT